MPGPLPNIRREKFCHLIVRGEISDAKAYEQAGFKARGHSAEQNASVLRKREEIINRVAELRAPVLAEMQITTTMTLRQLAALAFADIGEVMRWGPRSIRVKPSEKLTAAQRFMVKEVKKLPDGTVVVTLRDPVAALRLIGMHQGLFSDGGAVAAPNTTINNDNRTVVYVDRPPDETREQWIARHRTSRSTALAAPVGAAARPTD